MILTRIDMLMSNYYYSINIIIFIEILPSFYHDHHHKKSKFLKVLSKSLYFSANQALAYYAHFFTYYAFEQCSKVTHYAQYYAHDYSNYVTVCKEVHYYMTTLAQLGSSLYIIFFIHNILCYSALIPIQPVMLNVIFN